MTKEQMLKAIKEFFGDTSRSPTETREGLQEAGAEIDAMLETLGDDEND